jgi:predicted small secreted protein
MPIRKLTACALAAMVALLAGCNTMQGLGQDIERGGEKLQEKAKN